jgi:hypothetical protein
MLILAAALTLGINIEIDLGALIRRHELREPKVTCGIHTVGYRFIGKPGQQFRYAGETWTLPREGFIELIADARRRTYSFEGRTLPLDVWPMDQFSFRQVPLPSPPPAVEQEKENR